MGKSLRDWRCGHHALLRRLAGSTRYQRSDSSGHASICGFLSEGLSLGVYCNVGAGYVAASSSRSAHGALLEVHGSAFVYLLTGNHLLDAGVSKRQSDFQCRSRKLCRGAIGGFWKSIWIFALDAWLAREIVRLLASRSVSKWKRRPSRGNLPISISIFASACIAASVRRLVRREPSATPRSSKGQVTTRPG